MRSRGISRVLCCAVLVTGVILSNKSSFGANCALYVRAETGVALYGAAGGWWNEAEGRYARGQAPAVGAILVFKRTGHMRSGHVALVTKVVSTHEILVDHANWYHGTVNRGTSVIDTSSNHDWTMVAVMELRSGKHGRDNPTFGFIYPQAGLPDIVDSPASPASLFHLASAKHSTSAAPARKEGWTTHHTDAAFAVPTRRAETDRPVD